MVLRWLSATLLAAAWFLVEQRTPTEASPWDPWTMLLWFTTPLAVGASAMAWLPGERVPAARLPARVAVLLVASAIEMVLLTLTLLLMAGPALLLGGVGGAVGLLVFLWVAARLLPLGPTVLLSDGGPVASVGAAWDRSRGTALVSGTSILLGGFVFSLLEQGADAMGPLLSAVLLGVLPVLLLGCLSAWSYGSGSRVEGGAPLEPEERPVGVPGITPTPAEVEWERT